MSKSQPGPVEKSYILENTGISTIGLENKRNFHSYCSVTCQQSPVPYSLSFTLRQDIYKHLKLSSYLLYSSQWPPSLCLAIDYWCCRCLLPHWMCVCVCVFSWNFNRLLNMIGNNFLLRYIFILVPLLVTTVIDIENEGWIDKYNFPCHAVITNPRVQNKDRILQTPIGNCHAACKGKLARSILDLSAEP